MTPRIATVLGGTGFLGRAVVRRLAAEGYDVRVPIQRPDQARALRLLAGPGFVTPLPVSLKVDSSILSAFRDSCVVVNLIGTAKERKNRTFQATHVELAARFARLARAAEVRTFLHVSALGASTDAPSAYLRSKALGEEAVQAFFPDAIILRPSLVFGPHDAFFHRVALWTRFFPFVPLIDRGQTKIQPIYIGDVANAVAAALRKREARGRIYALGGPKVYTQRALAGFAMETLGLPARLVTVPLWAARALASLPQPFLAQDQIRLMQTDRVVPQGRANTARDLGLVTAALEDILPRCTARTIR